MSELSSVQALLQVMVEPVLNLGRLTICQAFGYLGPACAKLEEFLDDSFIYGIRPLRLAHGRHMLQYLPLAELFFAFAGELSTQEIPFLAVF